MYTVGFLSFIIYEQRQVILCTYCVYSVIFSGKTEYFGPTNFDLNAFGKMGGMSCNTHLRINFKFFYFRGGTRAIRPTFPYVESCLFIYTCMYFPVQTTMLLSFSNDFYYNTILLFFISIIAY